MKSRLKLGDALLLLGQENGERPVYAVTLAVGCTAAPLTHFLAAYLQRALSRKVAVSTGIYGDFSGNLERAAHGDQETAAVLEWADLDPRLGIRNLGAWGRSAGDDILRVVGSRLDLIASVLEGRPHGSGILLVPPSLPPAPVVPVAGYQRGVLELNLDALLAAFLARIAAVPRVRIAGMSQLDIALPERVDAKAWLQAGFPYRIQFASALAELIATAMCPPARHKGLITDLDNTLWAGILGETGTDNVHWDLDHKAGHHGLYQRFVQALAEDGILIGVATKNDPAPVELALHRPDILLRPDSLFPIEAHWQPKTESAARILSRWNIGPEAVAFVDDTPLELELMKAAFPAMDCFLFPANDPEGVWTLLAKLRDLFGKLAIHEEDTLRTNSLRSSAQFSTAFQGAAQEDILKNCGATLTICRIGMPPDPRALELINKTNQFNLNGIRYREAEWLKYLQAENASAWIVSYTDKFGALGKIAVLAGRQRQNRIEIDIWVMSCRAFSRRIEHALTEFLLTVPGVDELALRYVRTDRNTPMREFLEQVTGHAADSDCILPRSLYDHHKPLLYMTMSTGH